MTYKETLSKFLIPIKDDPVAYVQNVLEAIVMGSYTIFSIEITKYILRDIEDKHVDNFYNLIGIYAVVSIILIAWRFSIVHWGWSRIAFGGVMIQTEKYLAKFIQADGNTVEKIGTGRFISILEKGLYQWMDTLFELSFRGTFNLMMVFYAIFTIGAINIYAGMGALLLMILSGIVGTYANVWMSKKRNLRRKEQNEANHQTVITFMSKNELLQNNGFTQIYSKIHTHLDTARKHQNTVNIGFMVIEEFPRLMFLIVRLSIYIFIMEGLFSMGESIINLGILVTIITVAEKCLNEFLHLLRDILREFSSISILWDTFDTLKPIEGYESGETFKIKEEDIIVKNIDYAYSDAPIFRDFSLTVKKGQKTALVGASGGGKTTLLKLLAGYLHPSSGTISVLGNTLETTALKTYYPHIGYLTQEPSVFDATIRENLISALVHKSESEDKKTIDALLIEALKEAQCDFVFEMPDGLDTEIGERGVRLSGGQKQRLAIAKIFLKNPEIILLDEPTSALDSFSEEAITEALNRLFRGRTVIIVAHRLQTVRHADDIVVIEHGNVVERGVRETLSTSGGVYERMLELQSGF